MEQEKVALIEVKGICKRFPGVYALNNVDFDLYSGEVHALVGENGAGKSTLIKILSGAYQRDAGKYEFLGQTVDVDDPLDAIELGISVIYQELNLVDSLSVAENVYFGRLPTTRTGRVLWNKLYTDTKDYLDLVGLDINPKRKVQYLSVAEQQMVEIAKALSMQSKVIIMDEPTSSLSTSEIEKLFEQIERLKDRGVGIIYVSHKLDEIFRMCDRVTVLRDGEHIKTVETCDVSEDTLISMMVGRKLTQMFPDKNDKFGETVLEAKSISTSHIRDASFYIREGEIVGFAGLVGSGRTELVRAISGQDQLTGGEIFWDGKKVKNFSGKTLRHVGMGLIPEDRRVDGIIPNMSVLENISISSLKQFVRFTLIRKGKEKKSVDELVQSIDIRTPSLKQQIIKLSGGNQQKAIVARWLLKKNLKILVVDEPTRGIDVGAKAEIYNLLHDLAERGLAILMMSSELPEVLGICHRIYVMRERRVVAEFHGEEASQEKILAKAIK